MTQRPQRPPQRPQRVGPPPIAPSDLPAFEPPAWASAPPPPALVPLVAPTTVQPLESPGRVLVASPHGWTTRGEASWQAQALLVSRAQCEASD